MGRAFPSSASSSRSPFTEQSVSAGTSSPNLPTPPAPARTSVLSEASITSSPISRRSIDLDIPSPTINFGVGRKGTATPTISQSLLDQRNANPGPSRPHGSESAGLGLALDGMDPETRALIERFQREEEQAREAEDIRKRQLQADEEFAMKEQQSEREMWHRTQQTQMEQRMRQQRQIDQDEIRAVSRVLCLIEAFC